MLVLKMIHNCMEIFAQNGLILESWSVLFSDTLAFQNVFY